MIEVCTFVVGILFGVGQEIVRNFEMEFLDACPAAPTVCWKRGVIDEGNGTRFYVCVDDKKHIVYEGRLLPVIET